MDILNNILDYIMKVSVQLLAAAFVFAFNQQKRKYFWLRFIPIAAVYYFLFVVIPGHSWWLGIMRHQITTDIVVNHFYTFVFVLTVLIIWFSFKIKFQSALFYGTCAYLLQHLASSIALVLEGIIKAAFPVIERVEFRILMNLFIYAGIITAFYFFLTSSMKKRNSIEIVSVNGLVVSACGILFVAYFRQIFQSLLIALNTNTTKVMIFYHILAVFVCAIILFLLLYIYDKKDVKKENMELERLLSVQRSMHKRTRENVELINIKAHDLKKQIEFLRDPGNELEKSEILDGIAEAVAHYDEVVETGCKALDYVLTEKATICNKNNIIFTYMADGNAISQMKSSDIYSLFSNALDNAIECALKYGDEKRIISLKVMRQGKMTFIRIENYCDKQIVYEDGFPVTTKKDKNIHGFGVKSIKYLAQKYKGAVKIIMENNVFYLIVVLPE